MSDPLHSAPPVSYPVGRSRFAAGLLLGAWLLGALAIGLWSARAAPPAWHLAAALLALVLTGLAAAGSWWRSPAGQLHWGHGGWSWKGPAGPESGCVALGLDLQAVLLLRWRGDRSPARPVRWLWLERGADPLAWPGLRRAVYSRARLAALTDAGLPAQTP